MKSIYDAEYRRIIGRLVEFRKDRGVTQKQLAQRLNCPQPFISKVETFVRRLDLVETIRICEALGIELMDLLGRDKGDI